LEVREIQDKVELFFQENALIDCYFVDAIIKGKKIEVLLTEMEESRLIFATK